MQNITSSRPKKASKVKVMLKVFFNAKDIVHYEYLPEGFIVSQIPQ